MAIFPSEADCCMLTVAPASGPVSVLIITSLQITGKKVKRKGQLYSFTMKFFGKAKQSKNSSTVRRVLQEIHFKSLPLIWKGPWSRRKKNLSFKPSNWASCSINTSLICCCPIGKKDIKRSIKLELSLIMLWTYMSFPQNMFHNGLINVMLLFLEDFRHTPRCKHTL